MVEREGSSEAIENGGQAVLTTPDPDGSGFLLDSIYHPLEKT